MKEEIAKEMFDHLNMHLPLEVREKFTDQVALKEILFCLSSFVIIERRRALIRFTNRVVNARNKGQEQEQDMESRDENRRRFIDDLKELG